MVHLLHRLYGVDARGLTCTNILRVIGAVRRNKSSGDEFISRKNSNDRSTSSPLSEQRTNTRLNVF